LTDDDKATLIELLRETIERDRFPLSPRIKTLRAYSGEAGPSADTGASPPLKPPGEPSLALRRKQQR